jgi:hypothetical protein
MIVSSAVFAAFAGSDRTRDRVARFPSYEAALWPEPSSVKVGKENLPPGKPMYRADSHFVLMLDAFLPPFHYEGRPIADCGADGVAGRSVYPRARSHVRTRL